MSTERFGGSVLINGVPIAMSDEEVFAALHRGSLVPRTQRTESPARETLLAELDDLGFTREVPFTGLNGKRRFVFDAALTDGRKISVDYHGFGAGGAHQFRGKQAGDREKISEAALCGWIYLVCDAISVNNGKCRTYVQEALDKNRMDSTKMVK